MQVPWPAKVKTFRLIPSIDPTRSVRGISGAWTPEPIQACMSFEPTCAGWRDYRVGSGKQNCERYGKVAETVSHLAVAKVYGDSFRQCIKGVTWPIRECEWDKGGGFTKSRPGDSQIRFPDLVSFQSVTAPLPATGWPLGEIGGGRERPPFLLPGAGAGVLRNSHLRNTPGGGRSRRNYPWREGHK